MSTTKQQNIYHFQQTNSEKNFCCLGFAFDYVLRGIEEKIPFQIHFGGRGKKEKKEGEGRDKGKKEAKKLLIDSIFKMGVY